MSGVRDDDRCRTRTALHDMYRRNTMPCDERGETKMNGHVCAAWGGGVQRRVLSRLSFSLYVTHTLRSRRETDSRQTHRQRHRHTPTRSASASHAHHEPRSALVSKARWSCSIMHLQKLERQRANGCILQVHAAWHIPTLRTLPIKARTPSAFTSLLSA